MTQTSATFCPLCRNKNLCAVSANRSIDECWCQTASFPPKAAVKELELDGKSCICKSCLEKIKQELELGITRLE